MRGNQPGSPDTLFQELILASWSSSSIHTYMKLQKSTGPIFPPRDRPNGLEGIACGARAWGSLGQASMCGAADVAAQEGIGLHRKYCGSLSSVGRQAAAVPGCLQRDWLMQHQERAVKLAAWNCSLGWWVAAHGERAGSLCWGGEGNCFFL